MKAIVVTQDKCTRINPINGEIIEAFRPSVVTLSEFVSNLVMKRVLKPVGGPLKDTATDAEFVKFYIDSDQKEDLAVSSFMSKYDAEDEDEVPSDFRAAVESANSPTRPPENLNDEPKQTAFGSSGPVDVNTDAKKQAEIAAKIGADNEAQKKAAADAEASKQSANAATAKTGAK